MLRKMFTKDKFIADYDTAYDVYFYVNSNTRVKNQVFESDSTNKRSLKKDVYVEMKKNQFQSIITKLYQKYRINEGLFTLDFYPKK